MASCQRQPLRRTERLGKGKRASRALAKQGWALGALWQLCCAQESTEGLVEMVLWHKCPATVTERVLVEVGPAASPGPSESLSAMCRERSRCEIHQGLLENVPATSCRYPCTRHLTALAPSGVWDLKLCSGRRLCLVRPVCQALLHFFGIVVTGVYCRSVTIPLCLWSLVSRVGCTGLMEKPACVHSEVFYNIELYFGCVLHPVSR